MKNFLVCVPYEFNWQNAKDFSIIMVIFYLCLTYQIHYILFLNATKSAHRKLNSVSALLSQRYQCAVHTSTTTPHFFLSPPLTNFLVIPDSPFSWPSNLIQTVKQEKSLVIIFLTTQTLNNLSPHLYLHPFSLLPQSPPKHHFVFQYPQL